MLKPQLHKSPQTTKPFLAWQQKPFLSGCAHVSFPVLCRPLSENTRMNSRIIRHSSSTIKAATAAGTEKVTSVKAVVSVHATVAQNLSNLSLTRGLDDIGDLLGKTLLLELVAAELDPKTGTERPTIKSYAHRAGSKDDEVQYECEFQVPSDFGEVGAVLVENEHHKEMYLKKIVLDGFPLGAVTALCNSWVHSKFDNPEKRVFFTNKSYLPDKTPSGLVKMRERELVILRGDGLGERKSSDRVYDYDVYNDLGDPDADEATARPVLGGKEHPYPRRCRTGRPRTKKDPLSESRTGNIYVPRDEAFSDVKGLTFSGKTLFSVMHAVVPSLQNLATDKDLGFPHFTAIDSLFNEGLPFPHANSGILKDILPRLLKFASDIEKDILLFETPKLFERDRFSWIRDVEFSRQTLAGLNPCSLKLVTEWPLKSKLDPEEYGPPESSLTTQVIEQEIRGFMTVEEAIKKKKLFILDYHDLLMPYVKKVREQDGTTLYGSRALFFLTPDDTLKPLAIELTRPPMDGKPQWQQVFKPSWESTDAWLWKLAKVHVLAHDSGYHQLVSHWLRTHCATEPYIIAANRQLSSMHPIYRLLHPHFRYTMEINALARGYLVNANGIIEESFAPGKYSTELSSVAYDLEWQFDLQALPADLINRGMAVEDPSAPHGLKLTIEDYPYANDGLVLWDIIKNWVSDYVNHYYPEASIIQNDEELQAFWKEVREHGHADKKDEPWWPELNTQDDLIGILTTIIWIVSGHHAAVNFGQYDFAGYFPNRPTVARRTMPTEDPTDERMELFLKKPEYELLSTIPTQIQATVVMAILDVLSNHSPDEEYLGDLPEGSWKENADINAAFEIFNGKLKELEGIIDGRNADRNLKNRSGAGIVPYELLKPFSDPGVTCKGVPNSISI